MKILWGNIGPTTTKYFQIWIRFLRNGKVFSKLRRYFRVVNIKNTWRIFRKFRKIFEIFEKGFWRTKYVNGLKEIRLIFYVTSKKIWRNWRKCKKNMPPLLKTSQKILCNFKCKPWIIMEKLWKNWKYCRKTMKKFWNSFKMT